MTVSHNWLPLEANPKVFEDYVRKLEGPSDIVFADVWALEDWAFEALPKPVVGLILILPLTEGILKRYEKVKGQDPSELSSDAPAKKLWFTKQTIANACGTVALLHTLFNLPPDENDVGKKFCFDNSGPLGQLARLLEEKTPESRAEAMDALEAVHADLQTAGETEAPAAEEAEKTLEHFVVFMRKGDRLFEFDGRLQGPVDHGSSTPDSFLDDCSKVIKEIMKFDAEAMNFSLMAVSERSTEIRDTKN